MELRASLAAMLCVSVQLLFASSAFSMDSRGELFDRQAARKGYRIDLSTQEYVIGGNGHELIATQRTQYTVFNRRGWKEISPVVLRYSGSQKIETVELTIEKNGEKPQKIGRQQFRDYPAYPGFVLYSDVRALVYTDQVQSDSGRMSLSVRIKDERPVLSLPLQLQWNVPVGRAEVSVKAPEGWTIRTFWRNCPEEIRSRAAGNTFRWSADNVEPFLEEPLSPPFGDIVRMLLLSCTPPRPDTTVWAFDAWEDVSGWAVRLFEPRAGVTSEMAAEASKAVTAATSRLDTVRALYDLVRERTRYVAIHIGIGGFQPHPVAQTFELKYGDCKDMALLLCSLLNSVGIEALPVLVRTAGEGRIWPEFPSPHQFNHCIAYVPVSRTDSAPETLREGIYLDPTASMCSFGNVPEADRGTDCLVLGDRGGNLKRIPRACFQPDIEIGNTRIVMKTNGGADCTVLERHSGSANQNLRYRLQSMDAPSVQSYWSQRLNGSFPGAEFSRLDIANRDSISLPLEFRSGFTVRKLGRTAGKIIMLPVMNWKTFSRNPLDDSLRLGPVSLSGLTDRTDTVLIQPPAGYHVTHCPKEVSSVLPFASFNCSVECLADSSIRVVRSVRFSPQEAPVEQYRGVRDFIDLVLKTESESIVLESQ